ncbi:MAG TPA: hypothetical protein VGH14_20230 [Solirubrobacterales bacterium]|jgi:hypothetical protein
MAFGVGSASAFTGGGKSPSEAPLLEWGHHYEASLGNNKGEANYNPTSCCSDSYQVAIYKLGPVSVHDQVVVNWHVPPAPGGGEGYPVGMVLVENVDDFTWGSTFGERRNTYSVSGSGTARSEITISNSSANDYLEFYSRANENSTQEFETYQYDFSVESPRHYIGLALGSVSKIASNGFLHATATLASGGPVPDGYPVTLTGTWSGGGVFTTAATSVVGQITFPLAMPETAFGKDVEFVASGAATAEYQAATSSKLYAEITRPPAPPAPPKPPNLCPKATNHAHALARQYKRLLKHAERARGRARHKLLHRAHTVELQFVAARAEKKAVC